MKEEQHLAYIVKLLKAHQNVLKDSVYRQTEDIKKNRIEMNENMSNVVDFEDGDVMEMIAALPQIRMAEMRHTRTTELIKKLDAIIKKPYFGKMVVDGEDIYIGNMTFRDSDHNILIYDWRTPIASLFYENKIGDLSYTIPNGEMVTADVSERLQFIIEDSKLLSILDAEMYVGDEMLQALLRDTSNARLKNIVATIQGEQNVVIRQPFNQNTLVYGPPGSGKTSLAMQRIAYLLYHHRSELKPEEILLLNPNEVFNDYLSEVLPELGEENVKSSTFYRLKTTHSYLNMRGFETASANIRRLEKDDLSLYAYKNSIEYFNHLSEFIDSLEIQKSHFRTLKYDDRILFSNTDLLEMFNSYTDDKTIVAKFSLLKSELMKAYHKKQKELSEKYYLELYNTDSYVGELQELKMRAHDKAKKLLSKVHRQIVSMRFILVENIYLQSLKDKDVRTATLENFKHNIYRYEDIAPMMFLLIHLIGHRDKTVKHVLVDEIQDYSNLQYEVLRKYYYKATFTSLGDVNQRVHPAEIEPLNVEDHVVKKLENSYRSTNQINAYLNTLKPGSIRSVSIDGAEVVHKVNVDVLEEIKKWIDSDYPQIAIITPTEQEARDIYESLDDSRFKLLNEKDTLFSQSHLVLPYYLAKGFEFNTVLIVNSKAYEDSKNILYVLASRATRNLALLN